ncbi:MAG: N-acetylglucosamine-6-phosphate deacetylase, partial [Bryobacteraceae bacterium]
MSHKATGRLAGGSSVVQVEYDRAIQAVDDLIRPPAVEEGVAPGLIDVQVNGFAGVDYNDPAASHEAIARSIGVMFTTGVTRFFPTVITGAEERM